MTRLRSILRTMMAAPRPTLRRYALHGEALVCLALSRVAVRCCFRWIAPWALRMRQPGATAPAEPLERLMRQTIRWAAAVLPGKSLCLPQAIAGKWMLERRGFDSSIHLGAGLQNQKLHAHAWLEAGGSMMTGGAERHTVVAIKR